MPTAQMLSVASKSELQAIFAGLTDAYKNWLQQEAANTEIQDSDTLMNQAEIHLSQCRKALERMQFGASQIVDDDQVRRAFQCANAAMQIQAAWGRNIPSGVPESPQSQLEWRPFQLGFALMCIRSFQEPGHDDRSILDLIWFPTGGGKTEAYLSGSGLHDVLPQAHKSRESPLLRNQRFDAIHAQNIDHPTIPEGCRVDLRLRKGSGRRMESRRFNGRAKVFHRALGRTSQHSEQLPNGTRSPRNGQ